MSGEREPEDGRAGAGEPLMLSQLWRGRVRNNGTSLQMQTTKHDWGATTRLNLRGSYHIPFRIPPVRPSAPAAALARQMDIHQQEFAADFVYGSFSDHQHVLRAQQHYGPVAPANVWPFPQQSPAAPIDPSHMFSIPLSLAQDSVPNYPSPSGLGYHGANHQPSQPSDHGHQQPSDPLLSFNLTGPSIDSSIGPRRVTSHRRASQLEASSSFHPVHRQPAMEQRQGREPQNVFGTPSNNLSAIANIGLQAFVPPSFSGPRPSSPNGLTQSADLCPVADFSIRNGSDAQEHALGHASAASQPPQTDAAPRSAHRQAKAGSAMRGRAPSPTLSVASARTSASSGSNGRQTAHEDPAPPPPPPPSGSINKQQKHRLFTIDRRDICAYARDNPDVRQEDIARKWGVERSTISKILKHKAKWLSVPADETVMISKGRFVRLVSLLDHLVNIARHLRSRKFPQVELRLKDWLWQRHENRSAISDAMIRDEALRIAAELNISRDAFKASSGWVEDIKELYGISGGAWHGNGTVNIKSSAVGTFYQEPSRPLWGPSLCDIIQNSGAYPLETVSECTIANDSESLFTPRDLIKMTGSKTFFEAHAKLKRWEAENPDREPMWGVLRPHVAFSAEENLIEHEAVMTAELEARRLAREARDAGKQFDFKFKFFHLVKGALRGLPEAYTHGQPFPIRPRESHPDDIPEGPGPSTEDALTAALKVLSFAQVRRPHFLSDEHMQGLYHVYRNIGIIHEREVRRLCRINKVEEIANSDPFAEPILKPDPFRNPTVEEALAQLSEISGMTPDEMLEARNRIDVY
jgi:hypothetical protein